MCNTCKIYNITILITNRAAKKRTKAASAMDVCSVCELNQFFTSTDLALVQ